MSTRLPALAREPGVGHTREMSLTTVQSPVEYEAYFEAAERLIEGYFSAFEHDPSTGTIKISGERYTLVRAGSMSSEFFHVVQTLYGEGQSEEAERVARGLLFDVAHAMGIADAGVCAKAIDSEDPLALMTAGPVHFAYAGWAFVEVLAESAPSPGVDYLLVYDHPNSFEADAWLESERATKSPVCVMNAGYSSGWCERAFGGHLVATEITCRAKGDPQCRFVMADPSRIQQQVERYLAQHPEVAAQAGTTYEIPGFFARKALAQTIKDESDELAAYNRELERRVNERTAALLAANKALVSSQHFNDRLLEVMPGGVVQVTSDGAIVSANAEGQRILGMAQDSLTGLYTQDFETLTIYEDGSVAPVADYPVTRAIVTGEVQPPVTLGVERPDGAVAWAVFRAAPVRDVEGGPVTGAVVTFMDITERKAHEDERRVLEAQMQEAQRLESLGVLAGGVAHDFNNLLVGILGQASLVSAELPKDSGLREAMKQIELAASRAADLARQMLAYSGGAHRQTMAVDLSALTEEMLELVRASVPKHVAVKVEFSDLPVATDGDPAQIRQVVMNLIINAAEAVGHGVSGQGGVVTVSTGHRVFNTDVGRVGVSSSPVQGAGDPVAAGEYVFVRVQDNGPGMSGETLSKIFDPFFTTKKAGRGLGLAAVQGIVQSHDGRLLIDSRPGDGSSFEMLLPSSTVPNAEATMDADLSMDSFGGGLWLVIDDEPIVRTLARVILTKFGFEVIEACDGLEGVSLFRERSAEIRGVLLDVTMPVMNGREALERIWATRQDVPVLISSGYDGGEAMDALPKGGTAGFLPKPFRLEDMQRAIAGLLNR